MESIQEWRAYASRWVAHRERIRRDFFRKPVEGPSEDHMERREAHQRRQLYSPGG